METVLHCRCRVGHTSVSRPWVVGSKHWECSVVLSRPARMILTGRKIVTKVGILLPAGRRDASRRRVRQTYLTQSGRSAPPVTPGEAGWECSPSCQCGSWGNTPSDCKKTGWVMGNGVPRRNFTFWLLKLSLASRSNADECCGN